MKKKIYLSVDWDSRSISVSTKKDWEEYKEYLKEEGKYLKSIKPFPSPGIKPNPF